MLKKLIWTAVGFQGAALIHFMVTTSWQSALVFASSTCLFGFLVTIEGERIEDKHKIETEISAIKTEIQNLYVRLQTWS